MTEPGETRLQWHALAVHTRQEKAAAAELLRRGFEVFLPVRAERRAWSDRVQRVELALFPGYLFVHTALDAASRVALLKPHQSIELVGRLKGDPRIAQSIPDEEIDSLQTALRSGVHLDPVKRLVRGTPVRVASGPLRGVCGVVIEAPDGRRRIEVQVRLLGRGVRASLDADDLVEQLG